MAGNNGVLSLHKHPQLLLSLFSETPRKPPVQLVEMGVIYSIKESIVNEEHKTPL